MKICTTLKIFKTLLLSLVVTLLTPTVSLKAQNSRDQSPVTSEDVCLQDPEPTAKWRCEGYCLLGSDLPTNPWQPVASEGATEQEARDNIDCGAYEEVGITCRQIQASGCLH
jgi:hypothetical protein